MTPSISEALVSVALHVSAWIEITSELNLYKSYKVALHVSAWIEMYFGTQAVLKRLSRTPRECVD